MNYPTFSETGNISMHEVIGAKVIDFIPEVGKQFIVNELSDLVGFLKTCEPYCSDTHWRSDGYDKLFSDYIHDKLHEFETVEGRKRIPHFTLTPKYCFWYNIYCDMISRHAFYHCSEKDDIVFHIAKLEEMIKTIPS